MYCYRTTPLEDWISGLYRQLKISHPSQLDIIDISAKLGIWVYFEKVGSLAIEKNNLCSIILDKRLSYAEQWEDFGHELCHLLRQAGNQLLLPESFIELQETKAAYFSLNFCVPTFMLRAVPLPESIQSATALVAETFHVTPSFAQKRLEQYQRQLLNSQLAEQYLSMLDAEYRIRQELGHPELIRTGESTMLFCRERGVLGYLRKED